MVRFRVRDKKGGKNGGRKDCTEGKEEWDGWGGEGKNNTMNQTTMPYVNL